MAPCRGCDPDLKRNLVPLIFIGKPGGKLIKGAPGNYKQGETVNGPDTWAEDFPKIWKLAEEAPKLEIPLMGDDDDVWSYSDDPIIEETVSEPEPESEPEIVVGLSNKPVTASEEERLAEIARQYNASPNQFFLDPERGVITDPENIPELPRTALLDRLKEAGIPVKKGTRTTTLRKMVKEHGLEG